MADQQPRQTKLSQLQRKILVRIISEYDRQRGWNDQYVLAWGIRWVDVFPVTMCIKRSELPIYSRAVQRLEQRGLVDRRNNIRGNKHGEGLQAKEPDDNRKNRTTDIKLTPEGEALARRLKQETVNE